MKTAPSQAGNTENGAFPNIIDSNFQNTHFSVWRDGRLCGLRADRPGLSGDPLSRGALGAHDFKQAVQLAQSQLQYSPKNATLWTLKGIALSRLGRDKEALPAYNTALSISPD